MSTWIQLTDDRMKEAVKQDKSEEAQSAEHSTESTEREGKEGRTNLKSVTKFRCEVFDD